MAKNFCTECWREIELPPLGVVCADCAQVKPKFKLDSVVLAEFEPFAPQPAIIESLILIRPATLNPWWRAICRTQGGGRWEGWVDFLEPLPNRK